MLELLQLWDVMLFITGEAGYHTALDGLRRGMAVMELGHRESETFFIEYDERLALSTRASGRKSKLTTQKIWQEVISESTAPFERTA